jgi:hypothetical protein
MPGFYAPLAATSSASPPVRLLAGSLVLAEFAETPVRW